MNERTRAAMVIVIQCLLVASIAGKYFYERMTCPRVWVRVAQYDPNLPMRGRYIALSPQVNTCSLPHDPESNSSWSPYYQYTPPKGNEMTYWQWRVRTTARDGKLVVEDARNVFPRSDTQKIFLNSAQDCTRAQLSPPVDFFIPDTAAPPFPTKPGEELWAEVTVPPSGPPRPIQLAVSGNGQWKVLKMD